jgi:hypothetical protein
MGEKVYTINEIKAYAHYWLKGSLCADALFNGGEIENQRLIYFMRMIGDEKDSDGLEEFLKSSKYQKHLELGKRI